MSDTAQQAWRRWWDEEGSGMRPLPTEDTEQFAERITEIAWSNGAYARADDIERLRAELAAAKKRIAELEDALPRPTLSRCLQMEESLRHPKKEGGGA